MLDKIRLFFVFFMALSSVAVAQQDCPVLDLATQNQIWDEYTVLQAFHTQSEEVSLTISGGAVKALRINKESMPTLWSMVKNLTKKLKIVMPRVFVYEGCPALSGWNAFALSLYHNDAIIAIGQDLIKNLLPAELEGVVAHELGHVSGNHAVEKIIAGIALYRPIKTKAPAAVEHLVPSVLMSVLSRRHERQADQTAADLIKDPKNLGKALDKIDQADQSVRKPRKKGLITKALGFFSTHPSTKERKKYLATRARKKTKLSKRARGIAS